MTFWVQSGSSLALHHAILLSRGFCGFELVMAKSEPIVPSGVVVVWRWPVTESSGVVRSRPESSRVVRSRPESSGVIRSRPESESSEVDRSLAGVVWSRS